jgi:hypothetical protein
MSFDGNEHASTIGADAVTEDRRKWGMHGVASRTEYGTGSFATSYLIAHSLPEAGLFRAHTTKPTQAVELLLFCLTKHAVIG